MRGSDMVPDGAKTLKSSRLAKQHQLSVCVLSERVETPDAWLKDLERLERTALKADIDQARRTTAAWWQAFWNRSWVFVEENAGAAKAPSAVTRGYVLQRFMSAASGRGSSPIKFNGSIFTVEASPALRPTRPRAIPTGGSGAATTGFRTPASRTGRCWQRAISR